MAAVDYHGILTELKAIFEADATLDGVPVFVEEEPSFDLSGAGKAIVIVLDSRREGAGQPLAAGKRIRWNIRVGVWCAGFALSFERAAQLRDELVGVVEIVMMDNRTVNGKVSAGWLEGGAFVPVQHAHGISALAETVLVCEALAIAP